MKVQFLPITSITIENAKSRQRSAILPQDVEALASSILADGLLHPITVVNGVLVAGMTRFLAIAETIYALENKTIRFGDEDVPFGTIPAVELSNRTPLEIKSIEYAENRWRTQLSWKDQALAEAALQKLREGETGKPYPPAALAVELYGPSGSTELVKNRVALVDFLDDPDVAKAKSVAEAVKVVKRKEQFARNLEAASALKELKIPASHRHQVHQGNCFQISSNWQAPLFDVVLTDPPYGIGADSFNSGETGVEGFMNHKYDDSYENWLKVVTFLGTEVLRTCKPEAHLYAFCDISRFEEMKERLNEYGWSVWRTPIIWNKTRSHRAPVPGYGPFRAYECILFASKGKKPLSTIATGCLDVISIPPDENLGHSAQKPVALLQELLRRSTVPGNRVFDPFAGSGGIIEAAENLSLFSTSIELSEHNYGICLKRLHNLSGTTNNEISGEREEGSKRT